jgi:hypothetical protein
MQTAVGKKGTAVGLLTLFVCLSMVPAIYGGVPHDDSKAPPYGLGFLYRGYDYADTVELPEPAGMLPPHFDWRDHQDGDWTTPIRNQGQCGSCWAFGAIGALEAAINIEFNDSTVDMDLSEQYLVSCGPGYGCWGGWANRSFAWLHDTGGAIPESCFPYIAENGSCDDKCPDWENYLVPVGDYWTAVDQGVEAIKQALIDHGPLVADVAVYDDWFDYRSGILIHPRQPGESVEDINHQPIIVGYDDDDQCWIVKNSWGTYWGEDTYGVTGERGWCRIRYDHYFIGTAVHGVESDIIRGNDTGKPVVELTKPLDGWLYWFDNQVREVYFGRTKIIGSLEITAEAWDIEVEDEEVSGVDRVEFYFDGVLESIDTEAPYVWSLEKRFGVHEIRVIAHDNAGNPSESKTVEALILF